MAWSPTTAYLRGIEQFSSVVDRVPPDGWDNPTPCAGWRARDVLGHVGTATRFGNELLRGGNPSWEPSDPPGDAVEGEPAAWWAGLAADARAVVPTADLGAEVDSPAGRRSVAQGLSFPAVDLFVHAWDLGRSAGIEVDIPADAAEFARGLLDAMPPEQLRSPGVFAPEVAVPPGAGATEAFLAWTGRDPRWTPPRSPA